MKILFFGDSLSSGENNHFESFIEKLNLADYKNYGISGTTFGDYSLYPVGKNDLLSLIEKHSAEIKEAEIICIEYGINDISAYVLGNVNYSALMIAPVKCLDYIRQLNPNAKIIYLEVADKIDILGKIAESQLNYLETDYLSGIYENIISKSTDNKKCWIATFKSLAQLLITKTDTQIVLIDDLHFMDNYIDSDNIHPNDVGYQIIADKIRKELIK